MDKKILCIDNNPLVLTLVSRILTQAGFVTMTAHQGELGVLLAETEKPDLIFLDLMMPAMSGQEVCEKLRSNPELDQTWIVVLSSAEPTSFQSKLLTKGADDYFAKPFCPKMLVEQATVLLENKRESQDLLPVG